MTEQHPFTWRHFQSGMIRFCVRWYLRDALSSRDLEEMMLERGLHVDQTTMYRWVQHSAPELERRFRPHLTSTNDSWRVDETDIKVKTQWISLSRAVASEGKTLDFFFRSTRDAHAAKAFLLKTRTASQSSTPRVITVEKNAASPKAFNELKAGGRIPKSCE